MDDFKGRMISFIQNYLKTSNRKFEESCGLTNGMVSSIKEQGPTASVLSRIARTYPQLNMNWLICGNGQMILDEKKEPYQQSPSFNVENVQAVFITNWGDLRPVLEDAVVNQLKRK